MSSDYSKLTKIAISTLLVVVAILGLMPSRALAYKRETHKQIAAEAVELFNGYYPELALDKSSAERIIAGANDEDDSTRPLRHFYDPVKNRGLTISVKNWSSAKEWATDRVAQQASKPSSFLARVFAGDTETDFTWQKALEDYRNGDQGKAFYALGHVIHLIQDMAVPAHTRNDQHLFGDTYEKFSGEQNPGGLSVRRPIIKNELDDYFDELADYSNKNFYSPDTIGLMEYDSPEPDYPIFRDGYYYYAEADESGQYFLSRKSGRSLLFANWLNASVDDPLVLKGYWERLAPRALRYSAGVIYLFLKEAGLPEAEQSGLLRRSVPRNDDASGLLRRAAPRNDDASGLLRRSVPRNDDADVIVLGELDSSLRAAGEAISNSSKQSEKRLMELEEKFGLLLGQIGKLADDNQAALKEFKKLIEKNQPKTAEKKTFLTVGGSSGKLGALGGNSNSNSNSNTGNGDSGANANVAISEFLFDAEGADGGKEYVRLCNLGDAPVDISQWSLQVGDLASLKKKNFEEGNVIASQSPFLIWFGENPAADMLWKSGSLKNATSSIFLINNNVKIAAADDPAIIDRADYDVSQMPGFEPGQAVVINSCGGALSPAWQESSSGSADGDGGLADGGTGGDNSDVPANQAIAFYKNPNGDGGLIDIDLDEYPLADKSGQPWQVLVFYKDDEAVNPPQFITTGDNWAPDQEGVAAVSYRNYAGSPVRKSLIIPLNASGSGHAGGVMNSAYDFPRLAEDRRLRVQTNEPADYLIIAAYNFHQSGGGEQIFKLAAIDPEKYYWQDRAPAYQAPIFAGNNNLELKFNEETSRLEINWPKATDEDSLDNLIIFELTINDSVSETTFNNTSHSLIANPGDQFTIALKAKDEFNNYSETLSADWPYPMSELLLSQTEATGWSRPIGQRSNGCSPSPCPPSVSQQEIIADRHLDFNLVSVRLNTGTGEWVADLMLGVREGNSLIAVKIIPDVGKLNPDQDLTFIFDGLVTMEKDKTYNLTLGVSEYANNSGYYQSNIRNAINADGGWYIKLGKK